MLNGRKALLGFILFAALSAGAYSSRSVADESKIFVGSGVVCDTADQVKTAISAANGEAQKRLLDVKDRYGKEACNVVTIAFYKTDEETTVLIPQGVVHVVKVRIVGIKQGTAWIRMDIPTDQYTAILEKALSV